MTTVALALLLLLPATAQAWEVSKSSNGLVLNRSVDDTRAVASIVTYSTYLGSAEPTGSTYPLTYPQSYGRQDILSGSTIGIAFNTYELPLSGLSGWCMIRLTDGVQDERHVFYVEPVRVTVSNPTTQVVVSSMPSLSVSNIPSVSIAGTLPVDPWASSGLPDGWVAFVVTLLVVMAGGATVSWIYVRR